MAADTVALLLDAKVIPLAPADVRRACDATGVPVRFLQHRWHRIAEGLRPRPTARPVHRSAAEVVPRPVKRYGAGLYARLPTTSLAEVRRLLDEGGHQQKDIAIATGVSSSTVTLVKQGYYNDRLAS
ncbi:MAG: helix-turn-helix domain-containing protein [Acidimicrobiales bacterium]